MNIALFLTPKCDVTYVHTDCSVLHGMRKLRKSGFSAVPVITKEGRYAGSVSEGDFLWYLMDEKELSENIKSTDISGKTLMDVLNTDRNPPVSIMAAMEDVLERSLRQNFIPVVDDRGVFIGIVTRKDIIGHFCANLAGGKQSAS